MNQLKVNLREKIVALYQGGSPKRGIALDLGVDRVTVRKYLAGVSPKPPTPQTGSEETAPAKSPTPQTGSNASQGPPSLCEPFRQIIVQRLTDGGKR